MHIENNIFENIFNTIMDVKTKSKNTVKACKDLQMLCNRPELHLILGEGESVFKPKALMWHLH